ncbi:MAG: glycosyltransferase [Alphaproteobacteria bacterium]|nr:glycosyltransferase [Alphaproteobacteria bacterium]
MAYREGDGAVVDRSRRRVRFAAVPVLPAASGYFAKPDWPVRARRARAALPRCPELDCLRRSIAPGVLAFAELRAAEAGVGADEVLIAAGIVDEETYARALAADLGIAFEPLGRIARRQCPAADGHLIAAACTGLLHVAAAGELIIVVAPHLVDSRRLIAAVRASNGLRTRMRITGAGRLRHFVARHCAGEIERRSVDALRTARPALSAHSSRPRRRALSALAASAVLALTAPATALVVVEVALAAVFLAWTGLRVFGLLSERMARWRPHAIADSDLPVYSVIVALHREAAIVPKLVASLQALDYPAEKLQIVLALEPDDTETRDAIVRLRLGAPFEIAIAPVRGPRTKPKALNAALQFVRGTFVAVYDAEDRPEPDQLRRALAAFVASDRRLACVQARLTIDNTEDSWLARMFTAEYAGLFDVFLPGLAAWRLPLPLGGSSNHFRAASLRAIGAWDPYNVTEDADLGMRLARFGYRTTVIPSTTHEEAPAQFGIWLRQRTRWFKGWMQTWLVHIRTPVRLLRELGISGFAVFQLVVGGTVLAALVHAPFAAYLAWEIATAPAGAILTQALTAIYATSLFAGYLIAAILGLIGLARRGLIGSAWALLLMPLYWLLLSAAAWRALYQLVRDPYRWEKTEHGLARNSRLARITRPQPTVTGNGAGHPRRPSGAA